MTDFEPEASGYFVTNDYFLEVIFVKSDYSILCMLYDLWFVHMIEDVQIVGVVT